MTDVSLVGAEAAAEVLAVVREAFAARPALDPPAPALAETEESLAAALGHGGGLLATAGGRTAGALVLEPTDDTLWLRRVWVRPVHQGQVVARRLALAAEQEAVRRGLSRLRVHAREELPGTVAFWSALGYVELARDGATLTLGKELELRVVVPTADDMRALGTRLAGLLRAGDLLLLSGDLGAGKTTLTQGIGTGLGVRGEVTSPTFVIARVHPALGDGPSLVHVDAYRLGGLAEVDDLDLPLEGAVTVVEWGTGLADVLGEDRLEVAVERAAGDAAHEGRTVRVMALGARWAGSGVAAALGPPVAEPASGP